MARLGIMYVTNEEVARVRGNIRFLSSWAKRFIMVNVCHWKFLAGPKQVQKAVLWETSKGGGFLQKFPETWLIGCGIKQVDREASFVNSSDWYSFTADRWEIGHKSLRGGTVEGSESRRS